jgi:hypothetical protein
LEKKSLSFMHGNSISSGARYVILHSKIRWRKSKECWFGSGKWFQLYIIGRVAAASNRRSSSALHLQTRV